MEQLAQDIRTVPVTGAFHLAEAIAEHLTKLGYQKVTRNDKDAA